MYLDEDYLNIKPGARNGQRNGLTILLDIDAFEYEFFPKSSKGFIVALSSAGERPMVRQNGWHRNKYFYLLNMFLKIFSGFYVRPGTETLVTMKASRTEMKQDAIDFFTDPEYRQCYTEDQFQPLYYNKVPSPYIISYVLVINQSTFRTLGLATAWPTACTPVWLTTSWGPATAPPPSPRCPTWPPWTTPPASPCARGRVWSAWRSR